MVSDPPESDSDKSFPMKAAENLRKTATTQAAQLKEAAEERAQQIREMAEQQAEQLTEDLESQAGHLKDAAGESWDEVKEKTNELRVELERYVRQHPTKSVLISFGLGMMMGMFFRR